MSTPDIQSILGLVLDDRDPQDIYEAAIAELQARLPEWEPRETNIEVMLLEALALEVSELTYAINRVPNAVLQVLLGMFGITYDQGVAPTTTLRFHLATTIPVTIPEGTTARLDLPNDLEPVEFLTDAEVVSVEGQTEVTVTATANTFTDEANGYPAGTVVSLSDSLAYVDMVTLDAPVTGGRDEEDDEAYFARGSATLGRLTQTLVLPSQFESAALEELDVERAHAIDNYDSEADVDNNGPVGADPGYIAVAVYGNNEEVTDPRKEEIRDRLDVLSMAALMVTVIDPILTPVDITASIRPKSGYLAADVQVAVELALQEFLDPMNWDWDTTVRRNEVISVISNVEGVDFVDSLDDPATDFALTGVATLTEPGTISITMLDPV